MTSPPNPLSFEGEGELEEQQQRKIGSWRTSAQLWEKLKPLVRQMRHEPTPAENHLWQHLRNKQLLGYRFRRQHSIDRFIVDFYCAKARLIVEVDGAIHQYTQKEDVIRQEFLETQGFKVLRFSNQTILHNTAEVLHEIKSFLLPLSFEGEGAGG
jgi:very-short-patch-repair endonuclease